MNTLFVIAFSESMMNFNITLLETSYVYKDRDFSNLKYVENFERRRKHFIKFKYTWLFTNVSYTKERYIYSQCNAVDTLIFFSGVFIGLTAPMQIKPNHCIFVVYLVGAYFWSLKILFLKMRFDVVKQTQTHRWAVGDLCLYF